jgi:hypothetical protein
VLPADAGSETIQTTIRTARAMPMIRANNAYRLPIRLGRREVSRSDASRKLPSQKRGNHRGTAPMVMLRGRRTGKCGHAFDVGNARQACIGRRPMPGVGHSCAGGYAPDKNSVTSAASASG